MIKETNNQYSNKNNNFDYKSSKILIMDDNKMEIKFNNSDIITKASYLYNTFGPPNPRLEESSYNTLKQINDEIRKSGRYNLLFKHLLGEELDRKTKLQLEKIKKDLKNVVVPMPPKYNPDLIKNTSDKIIEWYDKNKDVFAKEIKKFFGFDLPKTLNITMNVTSHKNGGQGSELFATENNVAIQLGISYGTNPKQDINIPLRAITHELIHGLIEQNNQREAIAKYGEYFEEALLDYFVPDGMLAQELGLMKEKMTLDEICDNENEMRPYAAASSKELLPCIKEYSKNSNTTIFEFLK